MISVEEAIDAIREHARKLGHEFVALADAVGRTLAEAVLADVDSPPHDKSVMDGFAIRSVDFAGREQKFRVVESVIAGGVPTVALMRDETTRVMTGAPIPTGADAVIMVEESIAQTDLPSSNESKTNELVSFAIDQILPEKNVLRRGANFERGQVMFAAGHVVRPTDIGLLAEVGKSSLLVCRRPSVAVLPTGNELVNCDQVPGPGQIRNSNGPMLLSMARSLGLTPTDLGIGRDARAELATKISQGLEHNLLLLSGGVSAGTMDLVPEVLQELGVTEVFHKVKVKPGKPIWFGVYEKGDHRCYVFGLPGNPVSSLVGFRLFVQCLVECLLLGDPCNGSFSAELSKDHETRGNRPTYWPGKLILDASKPICLVEPLRWNGSSDLFSLGQANGLIHFPADSHQHVAGAIVNFLPLFRMSL